MHRRVSPREVIAVVALALTASSLQYVSARFLCRTGCSAYLSTPWTQTGRASIATAVAAAAAWESIVYAAALVASAHAAGKSLRDISAGLLAYAGTVALGIVLYAAPMYLATNFFVRHYGAVSMLYDAARLAAIVAGFAVALGSPWTAVKVLLAAGAARLILDPIPPLIYSCTCMNRTVVAIRLGSLMGSMAYVVAAHLAARRWCCTPRQRRAWTGWWRHV